MSVKLLDNHAFYGFRVRRTVRGQIYQEYFPLKAHGKRMSAKAVERVRTKAERRDRELAQMQRAAKAKFKAQNCFRSDNTVKGIAYLEKRDKSGRLVPIFQIGIASETEQRIVCTSVSLNAYGRQAAWQRAVKIYAKHKRIRQKEPLYQQLLQALENYTFSADEDAGS